ncbi:MAG: nitroreductase family protein [Desulfomonilia bacterium]
MDVFEAIHTRRSVREYEDTPIPDDILEKVLRAAMNAPSAKNEQPWHFVVITDRDILEQVPTFHPYAEMVLKAPVVIAVCADSTLERAAHGYWIADCSAATQNILLAAHALGLGAVWAGIFPQEERMKGLQKLLGLPEHVLPLALVPMGYPRKKGKHKDRFLPERIHYNRW